VGESARPAQVVVVLAIATLCAAMGVVAMQILHHTRDSSIPWLSTLIVPVAMTLDRTEASKSGYV
jgi:hypothetical protein